LKLLNADNVPLGSIKNNVTFLYADTSRLTEFRKLEIPRMTALSQHSQAGASTPENVNLFLSESLEKV
jgi:hypothetical protein